MGWNETFAKCAKGTFIGRVSKNVVRNDICMAHKGQWFNLLKEIRVYGLDTSKCGNRVTKWIYGGGLSRVREIYREKVASCCGRYRKW